MGDINNLMCEYLGLARHNADFWNGTVFGGKRKVKIWQLERRDREYYKTRNRKKKTSSVRKGVQMLCKGKRYIILAVEVMTTKDYSIPVRVMDYDAQELQRQIKDRIVPIKTVVLYCGDDTYDGAEGMKELLDIKGMEPDYQKLLQDYHIRIFNLKDLQEEKYETSFREIVGVFKRKDSRENLLAYYLENEARFRQLDELSVNVMGALIGMSRLYFLGQEKGGFNMCKAFEQAIEEGRMKGMEEGRQEGRQEGREEGLLRGREQGRAEGRKEGSFYMLCCLADKGILKIKDAAGEVGMTEEMFLESMKIALNTQKIVS